MRMRKCSSPAQNPKKSAHRLSKPFRTAARLEVAESLTILSGDWKLGNGMGEYFIGGRWVRIYNDGHTYHFLN